MWGKVVGKGRRKEESDREEVNMSKVTCMQNNETH
jgi:hypothetical protein